MSAVNIRFDTDGVEMSRQLLPEIALRRARRELLHVVRIITGCDFGSLDVAWNHIRGSDRTQGSLLYGAGKLTPGIHALAGHESILRQLLHFGLQAPAIIDVNFRIDSKGEEKYLFNWHQDYWFSVSSAKAVVAWIPLMDVTPAEGGVELIPARYTRGRIFKARRGETYDSYADGAVLDEDVPAHTPVRQVMSAGDVLFFRFDILHRSLPVLSEDRSRWTVQARFADFADAEFRERCFKPASVSASNTPYLQNESTDV